MGRCTKYETCPKEVAVSVKSIPKTQFEFIFVGCWGVYCKTGEHPVLKYKWKNEKVKKSEEMVDYGGKDAKELMVAYANERAIDVVILAGDNVYSDVPAEGTYKVPTSEVEVELFKSVSYNIEAQFQRGFVDCYRQIKSDLFLVAIGNHDAETCHIIDAEIDYPGWTFPGLSYVYSFVLQDQTRINLIFIDTNMYNESGQFCLNERGESVFYPKEARAQQEQWLTSVVKSHPNDWNIVIGHIPFWYNPHKTHGPTRHDTLPDLILSLHEYIDVYMCADEHNQQMIILENGYGKLVEVISGTGGAVLDVDLPEKPVVPGTQFYRAGYGFVGGRVTQHQILLDFHATKVHPRVYPPAVKDEILTYTIERKR